MKSTDTLTCRPHLHRAEGVQFALCEASKWLFYIRYESGSIYHPSSRDFELAMLEVKHAEAVRLQAIWIYWEVDFETECDVMEDELHPDHRVPSA